MQASLPLLDPEALADLPSGDLTKRAAAIMQAVAKGGRPKGSRNRRTKEMVEYLQHRYRDPLEGAFATFSRSAADLAAELGCTKLEAFDRQAHCMALALPYVHSKMPVAVNVQGDLPMLVLADVGQALASMAPAGQVIDHGPLADVVAVDIGGDCDA
ncbi:hypothetical protein A6A05_11815 [Magnetospirillum moscoviense]|uniref:Uncharacterized protein n=2 Tax=Magnetospirillum moscoviense TaxID=1437059 RepID=A0A178MRI0_9PROT|nr:hypothetical protein A6A05_11815 [Magnetospirillum moscoviense]